MCLSAHFLLLAFFCVIQTRAQLTFNPDGSSCTTSDGASGVCRLITACPSVFQAIQFDPPVNCGFQGDIPIVCCKDGVKEEKPIPVATDPIPARRKAAERCREYSRSVTYVSDILPLLPDGQPSTIESAMCNFGELPLIVGGVKTSLGEFPHMAALGYRTGHNISWFCGGTLISDFYVMTAAHCILTRIGPPVVVRLGELDLKRDDDGAHPQDYMVESTVYHPNYKPPAKYNDLGLIRLKKRVQFGETIRPACLYLDDTFYVNKTIATGWGNVGADLQQSDILQKVGLDLIGNPQCDKLYRSVKGTMTLPHGIDSTMLCAGELKGGKDTCQGDSGGPLQVVSQHNKCIYYVVGITSFGKSCAVENSPGVYTRVSQFLPWIVSIVWP